MLSGASLDQCNICHKQDIHVQRCHKQTFVCFCSFKIRLLHLTFAVLMGCPKPIFFLNSKRHSQRAMLSDSFLKHTDLPTSLLVLCFILFTGYLLSRELNTNCVSCFALTQFKIISHQAPIYLSELHLYTPSTVPGTRGSSALLQTSECSEYHPSALLVSTLFFFSFLFTRLHLLQPTPV